MSLNITHQLPKVINKSRDEIDAAIAELQKSNLSEETRDLMIGCLEFATWLPEAIREKEISIRNLQRMLFGEGGGKKNKKKGGEVGNNSILKVPIVGR